MVIFKPFAHLCKSYNDISYKMLYYLNALQF
jgi:hypothetical protein